MNEPAGKGAPPEALTEMPMRVAVATAWNHRDEKAPDLYRQGWGDCLRFIFDEERRALAARSLPPSVLIDECDEGHHKFAKLPGHPLNADGRARCPNCMAIGLDRLRSLPPSGELPAGTCVGAAGTRCLLKDG